jgi:hypothetical protein
MEHVVFYPAASGVPAFRRVGSLDEAVNFVEHLRNDENVTDFSVHELAPVQLSFRAYYHAQVPSASLEGLAESDAPQLSVVPAPAQTPEVAAEPAAVEVAVAPEVEVAAEVSEAPVEQSAPVVEAVAELETVADQTPEAVAVAASEAPAEQIAAVSDEIPAVSEEVTLAPIEATDEDRSAEWVAEAAVVEAPLEVPALAEAPEIPGIAADEPTAKPVLAAVEPLAEPVVAEASSVEEPAAVAAVQRTPFADAPPVSGPTIAEAAAEAEAEEVLDPGTADIIPALAPSGRRSLGFFAR